MKLWKLVVWFLVAAGLAAYIFYVERPAEEAKSAEQMPFSVVPKQAFKEISFVRKASAAYALENNSVSKEDSVVLGDKWTVKGINGATLDTPALAALINNLKSFKLSDELPKEELDGDLSVYGLKEPELVLAISREGGEKNFSLTFGKRSEFLTKRYVRVKDGDHQGIYLTDDALFTNANKDQLEFRNKTALALVPSVIKTVEIDSGATQVTLAKADSGSGWKITSPVMVRASEKTVQTMLTSVEGLRATSFLDGDAKATIAPLFNDKAARFVVNKGTPEERQILAIANVVSGQETEYYATISGLDSIIKLPADPAKEFTKSVFDLREKQYFDIKPYQISEVSVEKGPEKLTIIKENENWKVNDKKGDQAFIRDYLKSTSELPVVGYAEGNNEAAFTKPMLVLTAKGPGESAPKVLTIGSPNPADDSQFFAKVSDSEEVFFTSSSAVVGLFPAAEKLIEVMPQVTPEAAG